MPFIRLVTNYVIVIVAVIAVFQRDRIMELAGCSFDSPPATTTEALYAALSKDALSNPDVKGELGNILYAQRRYGEAADAYLATGKLLVGHANPAQILPIIGVLQSIAPQKAETRRALPAN
ncbi:MAG: hypothetical protein ACI8R4_004131 [Paracoccaceae bacterium]|jgi:hypothetical protein